jgi:hypothetical protein
MTDDPLADADIGETREIVVENEAPLIDVEPDEFWGPDRDGAVESVDAELIECDDGSQFVRFTYEGEAMKVLPKHWDTCREPRTDEELSAKRRTAWMRRLGMAVGVIVPMSLSVLITDHMMQAISGELTINGQPVAAPSLSFISLILFAGVVVALVFWAVSGGMPPRVKA